MDGLCVMQQKILSNKEMFENLPDIYTNFITFSLVQTIIQKIGMGELSKFNSWQYFHCRMVMAS